MPGEALDHVRIYAPLPGRLSLPGFLALVSAPTVDPFSELRCESLDRLSDAIRRDSSLKVDPACAALAFWLRRSNIRKMKAQFEQGGQRPGVVFVPAGRIFHIAPANVDTLFVYSWALGFVCGNSNIVRVSAQQTSMQQRLLARIAELMEVDEDLRTANLFITYEHDCEVTEAISRWCSHRIIWGGDETVAALRPLYLSPHASERVFGSKCSYSAISAARFHEADGQTRDMLAAGFFNDAFSFDQMACSSPHVVFWVGSEQEVAKAVTAFNTGLDNEVRRRRYQVSASQSVRRMNFAFRLAAHTDVRVDLRHPGFISMRTEDLHNLRRMICGGGVLTHVQVEHVAQVAGVMREEDQTITHFGLSAAELAELARLAGAKGVDRLVPVGEALTFSPNWDGFDLIGDFVRRVVVQV